MPAILGIVDSPSGYAETVWLREFALGQQIQ
jgi:hypothetical protein